MKYLNMVKYRLFDIKDSFIIYYIIILMIQLGKCIIIIKNKVTMAVPEVFIATAIFLFVCGLNSFKQQFKLLMQNGFSRQSIHWGFVAFLPIAIILSLVDYLIYSIQFFVCRIATSNTILTTNIVNPFNFSENYSPAKTLVVSIILMAVLYAATLSFGYMVSALFYRLHKVGKILIAVGIPAAIVFTSAMASISENGALLIYFARSMFLGSPYTDNAPFYVMHFICVLALYIILCLSASHLLIRKATIKQ